MLHYCSQIKIIWAHETAGDRNGEVELGGDDRNVETAAETAGDRNGEVELGSDDLGGDDNGVVELGGDNINIELGGDDRNFASWFSEIWFAQSPINLEQWSNNNNNKLKFTDTDCNFNWCLCVYA